MTDAEILKGEWMAGATCKGVNPEVFYPEEPHTETGDEARAMCAVCPVREQCLEYAILNHEPDGIWGGKTWRQRRRIRQTRARELREGPKPPVKHVVMRGPGGHFMGTKVVLIEGADEERSEAPSTS